MSDKIKILFLSANPEDVSRIKLDKEVREVDERIQLAEFRDRLLLVPHFATRPQDLPQTLMRYKPEILHFSGHTSPTNGIVFQDDDGKTKFVSGDALTVLLSIIKDNLRLVVLNACYTAPQAQAISQVVDFTIGMEKAILDSAAIVFSAAFYSALAYGRSVRESFGLGVTALMLEGIPGSQIPVLHCRAGVSAEKAYLFQQ